jgi:hypothetical protein
MTTLREVRGEPDTGVEDVNAYVESACAKTVYLGFRCTDLRTLTAGLDAGALPASALEARARTATAAEALRRAATLAEDAEASLHRARALCASAALPTAVAAENVARVERAERYLAKTALPRFRETAPRLHAAVEYAERAVRERERAARGGFFKGGGFFGAGGSEGGDKPRVQRQVSGILVAYTAAAEAEEKARDAELIAREAAEVQTAMDVLMGRITEQDLRVGRMALAVEGAEGATEKGVEDLEAAQRLLARRRRCCCCAWAAALVALLVALLVLQLRFQLLKK